MARLRQLVVVLPGIGGSELVGPEADGPDGYALTVSGLTRVVWSAGRLDIGRVLEPTRLVSGLTILPPLLTLPGYRRIQQRLLNAFDRPVIDTYRPGRVDPDVDVLLVAYDFRRSVADAAVRLQEAVAEALSHRPAGARRVGARRVIVVAHSLGGLVARYWIGLMEGWRCCQALVTMGTPVRGAPKALDWLVNGAGVGALRHPGVTRVVRGWPSVYELLPQYEAVWDGHAAVELVALPDALTAGNPGLAAYAPTFARMAGDARQVHDQIRAGWAALEPDQAPVVVPFLARGHATLNLASLDGARLRVSKQDPPWRGNVGWAGDGTVPAVAAIPVELNDRPDVWRVVACKHGPMGSIADPVEVLRSYAGQRPPTRGGELPDRPWLGLDLDEFAEAGQPVPIGVTLLPAPLTGAMARVTVTPLDTDAPPRRVDLSADSHAPAGTGWRGELDPLPVGVYELSVEVPGVAEVGTVAATDTLVVINTDTLVVTDDDTLVALDTDTLAVSDDDTPAVTDGAADNGPVR